MKRLRCVSMGALLVTLCIVSFSEEPCVPVLDPATSVAAAINACTAKGGLVRLSGTYLLDGTVHLKGDTILEGPTRDHKATLLAAPSLGNQVLLFARGSRITVRNLILDGNKFRRDYHSFLPGMEDNRPTMHHLCDADGWRPANSKFHGSDIDVYDFESVNAPCGSAMGIIADRLRLWSFNIKLNGFEAPEERNGVELARVWPNRSHQYSDGITAEYCGNCVFADGFVGENTDLDLVLGGGFNNHIYNVSCVHRQVYGFSCFNIGRFDGGRGVDGNHRGLVFENNTVSAGFEKLSLGLSIGGRFFTNDVTHMVIHDMGLVQNNRIDGAQVGIAVDAVERGELKGNTVGEVQGSRGNFNHCQLALAYVVGNVKPAVMLQPGAVRMTMHGGKCVAL